MKHIWLLFLTLATTGLITFWLLSDSYLYRISNRFSSQETLVEKPLKWKQDILEILRTPVQGEDNIFFIESSCAISGPKKRTMSMKPRQACAVESAAYLNPHKTIYYIDTCLDVHNFSSSSFSSEDVVFQVFQYANVYVFQVELYSFLQNTPLEDWIKYGLLNHSEYPVAHASDVLRLVTLWKFGGLYLDLDMVVLRPLDGIGSNFVVAESAILLGNSVLSFSAHGLGHQIVEICLRELAETYKGTDWSYNGPKLITRVMKRVCDYTPVKEMSAELCSGFAVKPPASFFPFPYQLWELLFSEEIEDFVMSTVLREGTYIVHAWNKMSHDKVVMLGSKQPYAQLAQRFCRRVTYGAGMTL